MSEIEWSPESSQERTEWRALWDRWCAAEASLQNLRQNNQTSSQEYFKLSAEEKAASKALEEHGKKWAHLYK